MRINLCLVSVLVILSCSPCQCTNLFDLILPTLTTHLTKLWRQGDLELLGNYCTYTMRPLFLNWKFYYSASVICPGWTQIRGSAKASGMTSVLNQAIEDFLTKALKAGVVNKEEVRTYYGK
ncbi:anti-lipopolysaccharide factor-like [Macrobrachium nipponense]|uniref:anti-lipopolysaccharide factor-like n=1 Tax=Macrobrachium nipponense TaxID=159736 RepID=UPI0030C7DB18|nr:anti-lipopolysaccharide factor 7 [Macrobrachium nipponense]